MFPFICLDVAVSAVWLYFIKRRDGNPIQSVRRLVDIWCMTNEPQFVYEVPSVRWDYLTGAFQVGFSIDGVLDATRAFTDMDTDWTYAERIDYLMTACLTSH